MLPKMISVIAIERLEGGDCSPRGCHVPACPSVTRTPFVGSATNGPVLSLIEESFLLFSLRGLLDIVILMRSP